MQRLLISGERKRNQSLKTLIIIQSIECYQPFTENLIGISGRRSKDQVQDLRSYLLRNDHVRVVKLSLAYQNVLNRKLRVSLCKSHFWCIRPKSRQFHWHLGDRTWWSWSSWRNKFADILQSRRFTDLIILLTRDEKPKFCNWISLALNTLKNKVKKFTLGLLKMSLWSCRGHHFSLSEITTKVENIMTIFTVYKI